MKELKHYSQCLLGLGSVVFLLAGCQSFEKRIESTPASAKKTNTSQAPVISPSHNSEFTQVNPNVEVDDNTKEEPDEQNIKPRPIPEIPKIGIILGPGGSRVYGEIGVLQEFQKNKIPIHSVAGMELGSLVGSLYAWRNSVNDVEWQMFKLKEEDLFKKSLLTGKKTADITSLNPIIKAAFHNLKTDDLKKPFACPALNLQNNQTYIMNKGPLENLLPFCLPFPPFFKPYKNNIGSTRDIKLIAEYLRSQGANYVIFINPLGGSAFKSPIYDENSTENLLWAELSSQLSKQNKYVDYTITLNLENYSIIDFSQRREIMQKGADQSYKQVQGLAQKLGL